jgi:hypothetical protein
VNNEENTQTEAPAAEVVEEKVEESLFTQEQVDEIVKNRLSRQSKKHNEELSARDEALETVKTEFTTLEESMSVLKQAWSVKDRNNSALLAATKLGAVNPDQVVSLLGELPEDADVSETVASFLNENPHFKTPEPVAKPSQPAALGTQDKEVDISDEAISKMSSYELARNPELLHKILAKRGS